MSDFANLVHDDAVLNLLRSSPDGRGFIVEDGILKPSLLHSVPRPMVDGAQSDGTPGEVQPGVIQSLQAEIENRDAIIGDTRERLKEMQSSSDRFDRTWSQLNKERESLAKDLVTEREERAHTTALLETERRRTERAKGYIDRVLDEEVRLTEPQKDVRPVPPAPMGPAIDSIINPPWRQDRPDFSGYAAVGQALDYSRSPPRRY